MDVWRITVAAVRRWYVLLPLLALTAVAAVAAGRGVQPEYQVVGTAMLVPGRSLSQTPNPYGNVDDANAAVVIVLGSAETRAKVAAEGLNPNYEVASVSRSTLLNFSVRADTPESGIATGTALLKAAEKELTTRQRDAGIPVSARYNITVLQEPSVSQVVTDGKTRIMAVVGLLGASLSLLVAVLFDDIVGLIRRWRQRRNEARSRSSQEARESATPPQDGASDTPADNPSTANGREDEQEPTSKRAGGSSSEAQEQAESSEEGQAPANGQRVASSTEA